MELKTNKIDQHESCNHQWEIVTCVKKSNSGIGYSLRCRLCGKKGIIEMVGWYKDNNDSEWVDYRN